MVSAVAMVNRPTLCPGLFHYLSLHISLASVFVVGLFTPLAPFVVGAGRQRHDDTYTHFTVSLASDSLD